LVTLRHAIPFPKQGENVAEADGYLRALDMHLGLYAWELDDLPAIKFAELEARMNNKSFHAIVAANEAQLPEEQLQSWGGRTRSAYIAFIAHRVDELLSRWALIAILAGYERRLNAVRDSTAIRSRRSRTSIRVLRALSDFAFGGVDISAVSTESMQCAGEKAWTMHEIEGFHPSDPQRRAGSGITLGEALRTEIKARAEWLLSTDRSMRALLTQYAEILSARENIGAQNSMGRLTWVLIILTVLIALLTVPMADAALKDSERLVAPVIENDGNF
jgi:hypothetical protein